MIAGLLVSGQRPRIAAQVRQLGRDLSGHVDLGVAFGHVILENIDALGTKTQNSQLGSSQGTKKYTRGDDLT